MTNPMRAISVGKVVVNIGVGEAGEKLLKAVKVLELVTGHKPVQTLSRSTIRDWGIRRNMPIGTLVTLRGKDAFAFLKKALAIRSNRLAGYSFDPHGNFSFGIPDYTDFEGMRYDPEIGVFGMDIAVVLKRPGWRVAERKIASRKIPRSHRITREEGIEFVRSTFNAEVVE
ncbi:MAG TPA: 50S ribosomal protein L5 [Thermoplasmata archaeon]|uniref:Large ribosomal subunit protein uL5 n=2 Tax=environmental samples TaxID=68359 RepID=A0A0H4TT11_9EURY|nr:LSU ribosomal protein L5P [uncultured euryarchaeote Rifle_16ft_4_minimus_34155]AKQ03944.1 LSU ribosomal protein L5P [uncultured euryarchaeote Rifle_16ft_4_minimus_39]